MTESSRPWVGVALCVGVVYVVIGRLFALPTDSVQAWRLGAWAASGAVYAAHLAHEHFRLRNSHLVAAAHVATAVAIGGFGLAVAGMYHAWSTTSGIRAVWLLALVLWPAFTAAPAFIGALIATALAARLERQS